MFTLMKSFKTVKKCRCFTEGLLQGFQCVCRWELHLSDFSVRLLSQRERQFESHSNLLLQNKHKIYFEELTGGLRNNYCCLLLKSPFKRVRMHQLKKKENHKKSKLIKVFFFSKTQIKLLIFYTFSGLWGRNVGR